MPGDSTGISQQNLGIIGLINEFDHNRNDFSIFEARLEQFFIANDIKDPTRKRAVLLNYLAEDTYKLIKSLCVPNNPESKSYDDLVSLLKKHLTPVRAYYAARFKFYNARKESQETVNEWAARVRSLAACCGFGIELSALITDKFVTGMDPGPVMDRLFEEDATTATWDGIIKIAQNKEAVKRDKVSQLSESQPVVIKTEAEVHRFGVQHSKSSAGSGKTGSSSTPSVKCRVCGRKNHAYQNCKYKNYKCNTCGVTGHLSPMCNRVRNQKKTGSHKFITETEEHMSSLQMGDSETVDNESFFNLHTVNNNEDNLFYLELKCDENVVRFEIDSGSQHSIISENLYNQMFHYRKLYPNDLLLKDYVGNNIVPCGKMFVNVGYRDRNFENIPFYVIKRGGPPLVGRSLLKLLNLGVTEINHNITIPVNYENLFLKYSQVFRNELGTFTKGKIELKVKPNAHAKFFKARPVPFALKGKVEEELDRLQNRGVLEPVENSDWATPLVVVMKPNNKIRLCGDYRITLNPVLEQVYYPLPRIEYIFENLKGGIQFSKIDLSDAYQQVLLTPESQQLVTISTHKGLFKVTRLPFGICNAPSLFQKMMENIIIGIPGVACFLDDIVVTGENSLEHLTRLELVLQKLQECGLTVRKEKCKFFENSICYLGHVIDREGLHTSNERVLAIEKAPIPTTVSQLKSFLGMINFYCKFLPNAATILYPLYKLLKKGCKWNWDLKCNTAFEKAKEMLLSASVLDHYDPEKPAKLICDASAHAVGAVIVHMYPNGRERPIAFASRVLNDAEQRYSQIDREGLSIIFGLKKFNQYLMGRHFVLVTDHKPLLAIFGPKKGIPIMAASRLQRWAQILSSYDYVIQHVPSEKNQADWLSRITIPNSSSTEYVQTSYLSYFEDSNFNITWKTIKLHTRKDPVLAKILKYVLYGWPDIKFEKDIQPYANRKLELTSEQDCIMWGYRIVIPEKLRKIVLQELHSTHMGIVKMKALARSYFWWPSMDKEIENIASSCSACLQCAKLPAKSYLKPYNWPKQAWYRLHIDYFGPVFKNYFFVIQDAYSKWIECFCMPNITTTITIQKLRECFARFGLPVELTSDNGAQFTSLEFQSFLKLNGIRHLSGAPFHPSSNGAAESAVAIMKHCIQRAKNENSSLSLNLIINRFLFYYRNTDHSTTGECPAKLLINRKLRCKFDLIVPSTKAVVENNQFKQCMYYGGKRQHTFDVGDFVYCLDYRKREVSWIKAEIIEKLGDQTYVVKTVDNMTWKRHIDQLKICNSTQDSIENVITKPQLESEVQAPVSEEVFKDNLAGNDNIRELRRRSQLRPPERLNIEKF